MSDRDGEWLSISFKAVELDFGPVTTEPSSLSRSGIVNMEPIATKSVDITALRGKNVFITGGASGTTVILIVSAVVAVRS